MHANTTPRINMVLSVSLLLLLSSCLVNGFVPSKIPLATRQTLATTTQTIAPLQSVRCKEEVIPSTQSFATSPSLVLENDENKYANDTAPASPLSPSDLQHIVQDTADSPLESLVWRGAVVGLCAVWASNFPATKLILAEPGVDSMLFAVARFSTATLALLPFAIQQLRAADPAILRGSAVCGAWVAFGYLGQLLGLLTTTASRSCVICSLHCVFVAIIAEWMRVNNAASQQQDATSSTESTSFDLMKLAPAALAVTGVAIVELQGAGGSPTIGDLLSFSQPIGFGIGYLKLEELMRKSPESAVAVSTIKLAIVSLASLAFFELQPLITSHAALSFRFPDMTPILQSPIALAGVAYTGLLTTAFALYIESIAFRRVPATDASIILTTEPLFAAALGAVTLGETFGMSDYVGAGLIVTACVAAVRMESHEE